MNILKVWLKRLRRTVSKFQQWLITRSETWMHNNLLESQPKLTYWTAKSESSKNRNLGQL